MFESPMITKLARGDERSTADGVRSSKTFRQRKELGVAPHVKRTRSESVPAQSFPERRIVKDHFKRRKTIFAERTRDVTPGLFALAALQLILIRHSLFLFAEPNNATCCTTGALANEAIRLKGQQEGKRKSLRPKSARRVSENLSKKL